MQKIIKPKKKLKEARMKKIRLKAITITSA